MEYFKLHSRGNNKYLILQKMLAPSESSFFPLTLHITVIRAAEPNTCSFHSRTKLHGSFFKVTRNADAFWLDRGEGDAVSFQNDRFERLEHLEHLVKWICLHVFQQGCVEDGGAWHSSWQKFCWHDLLVKVYKTSAEQKGFPLTCHSQKCLQSEIPDTFKCSPLIMWEWKGMPLYFCSSRSEGMIMQALFFLLCWHRDPVYIYSKRCRCQFWY